MSWRELVREIVGPDSSVPDYSDEGIILHANSKKEGRFRRFMLEVLRQNVPETTEELINSGAEVACCSQLSTRRYLAKMISEEGPAKLVFISGEMFVVMKPAIIEKRAALPKAPKSQDPKSDAASQSENSEEAGTEPTDDHDVGSEEQS